MSNRGNLKTGFVIAVSLIIMSAASLGTIHIAIAKAGKHIISNYNLPRASNTTTKSRRNIHNTLQHRRYGLI
jgi:hypothetical protein